MRSSSYLSTSQAAQMLGLSVGTVQRMVESGSLQAFTTQGGHRRILLSSVQRYCQLQGIPGALMLPPSARVCVVHPLDAEADTLSALDQLPQVQRVSHPLELAGLHDEFGAFFIDARVGWLDWPELHRPQATGHPAPFIVYHSEALSPQHQTAVARQAQLHPGDISADLVQGYLLGMNRPEAEPPRPAGIENARSPAHRRAGPDCSARL